MIKRLVIFSFLLLAACGTTDVKETLGLNHKAPDEFRVISRPPLSVPPEFNLIPPVRGAEYSASRPADEIARDKVLGNTSAPNATSVSGHVPSNADEQFLSSAGVAKTDKQVRDKLEDDKAQGVSTKDDHYLFSGSSTGDPLVNPAKEKERLQNDKAQNKPPTEGETPVIKSKNKGILGDLF